VQFPDVRKGKLRFSTGGTVENWGPIRAPLYPTSVTNPTTGKSRSGFFLHLDVKKDGTAGCIGVPPESEGKFNQIMALIHHMPNKELPVTVEYGKPCASSP
jgi:L,D-peptidoglycan transpeptidase YkuD (ErfK/YbiS/YcfS/YnhG family)